MTKQTINVGQVGNDGAGDKLRNAFVKVNENFTELYDSVSSLGSVDAAGVANLNSRINTAYTVANAAFDVANTGAGSDTANVTFFDNVVQGTGYEIGISPGSNYTDDNQYFRFRAGRSEEHTSELQSH